MSTAPPSSEPPTDPAPSPPTPAWVWPLVILLLAVLLLLAVGAGLAYVTWRHPSLGTPVTVVIAFATGIFALIAIVVALARR